MQLQARKPPLFQRSSPEGVPAPHAQLDVFDLGQVLGRGSSHKVLSCPRWLSINGLRKSSYSCPMSDPEDERVNKLFKEWQRCRDRLRKLREFPENQGEGGASTATGEVAAVQSETDRLFTLVLQAMSDREVARQSKDRLGVRRS